MPTEDALLLPVLGQGQQHPSLHSPLLCALESCSQLGVGSAAFVVGPQLALSSKTKLPGLTSFQILEGWVLSVILGIYSSRFVVGMDFFFSVLLHGMLSPERRGDFRRGWTFLK